MPEQTPVILKSSEKTQQSNPVDRKLTPVVSKPGQIRRKTKGQKLKEEFVNADAGKVGSYLFESVIMPSIKDTIWNLITKGLRMFLFKQGEGPNAPTTVQTSGTRVNWQQYYPTTTVYSPQQPTYQVARTPMNYGEVVVGTEAEATDILRNLQEIVQQYRAASIGDLYQLAGLQELVDTYDFNFGWINLNGACITQVANGWLIHLPTPMPIKR